MGIFKFFNKIFSQKKESKLPTKTIPKLNINTNSLNTELKSNNVNSNSKETSMAICVFLNWAKKGYPVSYNIDFYPRYFKYSYGILNPTKFHKEMIQKGYLIKPTLFEILSLLKVTELKEILEKNKLSKSGKKSDLINRILNNIPIENLNYLEKNFKGFSLSQKGIDLLNKNKDLIELHKNSNLGISLNEYLSMKSSLDFDASFNDVVWGIFNKRNIEYVQSGNWGLLRNNRFNMFEILNRESKFNEAIYYLIEVLFFDLSGLINNNIIEPFDMLFIAPGVVDRLTKLKDYYTPDLINLCYERNKIPFTYFDKNIFLKIVQDLIDTGYTDLNDYKKYAKKHQ